MFVTTTANTISNIALAVIASAAMLGFTAVPVEARSVPVSITKAELQTSEGRAAIDARVQRAARKACDSGDFRDLKARQMNHKCVTAAVSSARTRLATLAGQQMASN